MKFKIFSNNTYCYKKVLIFHPLNKTNENDQK